MELAMAMDVRAFFLAAHAMSHGRAVAPGEGWNLEDLVLCDVTDAELRRRQPGHTSIAWSLWHMARSEDVAVNAGLRAVAPVLERDGWRGRLGIERRDNGFGMSDAAVDAWGAAVDLAALRAYRVAVGRETRAWAETADLTRLAEPVAGAGERAAAVGAFGPAPAPAAVAFWGQRSGAWFLHWLVVGHNQGHLDGIQHLRLLYDRQPQPTP
jgi:DinB superfamily